MKKPAILAALMLMALGIIKGPDMLQGTPARDGNSDLQLQAAFDNRQSDLQVAGEGEVVRLLPDDNKGSRHQRFLLRLDNGLTLLVAHNIDLAPRIDRLQLGDRVAFYGEYEWNEKGGVIHWTHDDPNGNHPHGWLKHQGQLYQ